MARELSRDVRLFYIALWNEADDEGRFQAHPRRVLGVTFPYDRDVTTDVVEDWLRVLASTKRLLLYQVDGEPYGQLTKWHHQKISKATPSRLPSPPDSNSNPFPESSDTILGPIQESSENTPGGLPEDSGPRAHAQDLGSRILDLGAVARRAGVREANVENSSYSENGDEQRQRAACIDFVQSNGYGQTEVLIAQGEDTSAWRGPTGDLIPWTDRPRLLKLAHARVQDGQSPDLRKSLRYVIPQQLDPHEAPTSNAPRPGTEHERVHRTSLRDLRRRVTSQPAPEKDSRAIESAESERYAEWRGRVLEQLRKESEALQEEIKAAADDTLGDGIKMIPKTLRERTLEAEMLRIYGERIQDPQPLRTEP